MHGGSVQCHITFGGVASEQQSHSVYSHLLSQIMLIYNNGKTREK